MEVLNEELKKKLNDDKREFTDAYYFCGHLLKANDFCFDDENGEEKISKRSAIYGQKMFEYILKIKEEMSKTSVIDVKNEQTKLNQKNSDKESVKEKTPITTEKTQDKSKPILSVKHEEKNKKRTTRNSLSTEPEEKKLKQDSSPLHEDLKPKKVFIPYEEKVRIVKLARKHPKWSLTRLKEEADCQSLKSFDQLNRWIDQVETGGSRAEIKAKINKWVYAKCIECKESNEIIYNDLLQLWANKAKIICFPNTHQKIKFGASTTWLNEFKKLFNINGPGFDLELNDENICKKPKQDDEKKEVVSVEKGANKQRDCLTELDQTISVDKKVKIKTEVSSDIDEAEKVNHWIYQQCLEYRAKGMKFSNEMIKEWAIKATNIYVSQISQEFSQCDPSDKWLCKFKKTHGITGPSSDLQLNDIAINLTKENEKENPHVQNEKEMHVDEEIPEVNIKINSVTSLASEVFKPEETGNESFKIKTEPV